MSGYSDGNGRWHEDVVDLGAHKSNHDDVLRLAVAGHFMGVRGQALNATLQAAQAAMEEFNREAIAWNEQFQAASAAYAETATQTGATLN